MRTLLLTGYDDVMAPIGDLTFPLMMSYARRHGLDCARFRSVTPGQPAYWEKVPKILTSFRSSENYERIIWLDADQMITNPDYDFGQEMRNLRHGFHAPKDWGEDAVDDSYFSMCGFVIHRDSIPLLEWLEEHKADWIDKPFPEQAPMQRLFRTQEVPAAMYTWPRKWLNCVPDEVCPGKVPEPWQPGDFAAHLTMLPVERRVELFQMLKAKVC